MLNTLTYEQCVVQGVGPLLFPERLAHGDYPPHESMHMKAICVHTMQQQVHLQHVLEQAWRALEQAGIQAVLLKGAGLAALYPEPRQRAWGDIDLFVGKDQYHAAAAAMRATFPDALKFDEELDHYKHYNLIADGVSIEVHRVSIGFQDPRDERRYARIEAEGMEKSEWIAVNGLQVRVPEPTFNALFVMMHSWEHMQTQGANIRQLCDLAFLLRHYQAQIDRPRLKRYLRALHLTDVWQIYMSLLVNHLDLQAEQAPFYTAAVEERAARLWQDLLAGKMVAPKAAPSAPRNRFARKWHTMRERMRNADRMAQYSPSYALHMRAGILLSGLRRLLAKDRHWE